MADLAKRRGRVMGHPVRFLGKTLYVPLEVERSWMERRKELYAGMCSFPASLWLAARILGVVNNAWLTKVTSAIFGWSLETFGWLYQWVALGTLLLITNLGIFSPGQDSLRRAPCQGKIFLWRLVCHDAYRWNCNWPHYLWCQWTYHYLGNIYGELEGSGIEPYSQVSCLFFHGPLLL